MLLYFVHRGVDSMLTDLTLKYESGEGKVGLLC